MSNVLAQLDYQGHTVTVVRPHESHIAPLLETMRPRVKDEVHRSQQGSVEAVVRHDINESVIARVALIDGQVAAAFGVVQTNVLAGIGSPWCFPTTVCDPYPRLFMEMSKFYVERFRGWCPTLVGQVDGKYEQAVRWLRWLGFTIQAHPGNGNGLCLAVLLGEEEV